MSSQVNITSINGVPPFNIWICDYCGINETCIYIASTNENDYSFTLPQSFENSTGYCVKVVDYDECEKCNCFGNSVSNTPTPSVSNSITPTITVTPTNTPTSTPSITVTPSNSATPGVTTTPSNTVTPSITISPSNTVTPSNSATPGVTTTPSNTVTPSITPTNSVTPSITISPSNSITPSITITPSNSATPGVTTTPSNTVTPSITISPSNTVTPSNSATPGVTTTPSNTVTPSITISPSNSATPSITISPSVTPSNTVTPSNSATPGVTTTPSNTVTPSITISSSVTPSNTVTPSITISPSNTATPSVTPSNTVTPSITVSPSNTATPTPSASIENEPANAYSFYDCCNDTYFTVLTGGTLDPQYNSNPLTIGTTQQFSTNNSPFETDKCYERVNYNSSYTQYNLNSGFWLWGAGSYDNCDICITGTTSTAYCNENNVSLSGCCDGEVYNVTTMSNGPDIGESAVITNQIGGASLFIVGNCYTRVEYNASYPTGANFVTFTYNDYYQECTECTSENTCIEPSPTPTVTPTVTPTITLTPTPTSSVSYDYWNIEPCCDNMTATTQTTASIPSSYGLSQNDVVSLDNICYTLTSQIGSSSYYPTTINTSYTDADDCISDTNNEPCAYTYEACAETVAGLGDLLVLPTQINLNLNSLNPNTYAQIGVEITSNSSTFPITECYNLTTYDENIEFITTYSVGGAADCLQVGKCEYINVLLENCVNGQTSIANLSYDTSTGYTLNSGDTISAPALAYTLLNTTTGTCFNIGGKTTTITSNQSNGLTGTFWESLLTKFSVQTNCADSDCGCKTNFTINDESGGGVSNVYYKSCDGSITYGPFTIPPSGFISVTQCVNVNTLWAIAVQSNYSNDISIGGTYSNC